MVRILASATVLRKESGFFGRMLSECWAEGMTLQGTGHLTLEFREEEDPGLMLRIIASLHGNPLTVPSGNIFQAEYRLPRLLEITYMVVYLDCAKAIAQEQSSWLQNALEKPILVDLGHDAVAWLWIALAYGLDDLLKILAPYVLWHTCRPINEENPFGIPVPLSFVRRSELNCVYCFFLTSLRSS